MELELVRSTTSSNIELGEPPADPVCVTVDEVVAVSLAMAKRLSVMGRKVFATFALYRRDNAIVLLVDAVDRQIVAVLQEEGRITLTELADRVRLSVSRCQRRVRELE